MCPSGFYNLIENVIGANNMNNHTGSGNNATDTLLGNNFELYQYLGDKDKKAFFKEGIVLIRTLQLEEIQELIQLVS